MSQENPSRELVYELQVPFDYALKGETVTAVQITLNPPTSKNLSECSDLKQAFFRSLPDDQDGPKEAKQDNKDEDLDGDAIMTLISMSHQVQLKSVLITARELFRSGVALVDGETKLTIPLLDLMDIDDLTTMTGQYMVNFILASSLKKLRENSQTS